MSKEPGWHHPMSLEILAQYAQSLMTLDGRPVEQVVMGTAAELGEFCEAVASEDGHLARRRELKEPSSMEAVDIIVSGIALYVLRSGRPVDLAFNVEAKFRKWHDKVEQALNQRQAPAEPHA